MKKLTFWQFVHYL